VIRLLNQKRRALFREWLRRRVPPVSALALSHRNVFILPSRVGWVFVLLLVAMLLTAINYQNSLVYALTFWLLSMGVGTIWLTFRNLAGLHISAGHADSVFAGSTLVLPVRLKSRHGWSVALQLGYPGQEFVDCSVPPGETLEVRVPMVARKRGRLPARRLKIYTRYPFGLLTAWSWVALDYPVIVWPERLHSELVLGASDDAEDDSAEITTVMSGHGDVASLRDYIPGDSIQRISWKHSARTGDLKTLERETEQGGHSWLRWSAVRASDNEDRLSILSDWVVQSQLRGLRYGLQLPGEDIAPDSGEQHYIRCLNALALWGDENERR